MMNQIKYLLGFFSLIFLCGCSNQQHQETYRQWVEKNGKIKVLSTTAMINDLVKQIGGDYVDSMTLIKGDLDPHSYQLVKGDDEKLSYADVIFYNGLGLEHGPSLHHYLTQNSKAISLGDRINKENPGLILYVNGQLDPHIWMDVSIWLKNIPTIVKTLSDLDPERSSYYAMNGNELEEAMIHTHQQIHEIMHQIPSEKRFLVTSHDAFNYFARAYLADENELENDQWTKRFAAPEGLAPESQLSAVDIRYIIDHLHQYQIHLIFPESNVSKDSIKKIIQAGNEKGLNIQIACCPLYGDAMGPPGSDGDTYLKMILHNANTLATHLNHVGQQHAS
ncbi:MAG: zinc ABC transporter substrate-binding protein [Parachlamydiaceae bacterium]|nr:zinc ABC transporter substrate-binding protein [Parachlamydiaceae bacterium]